jgi:Helix-turn-helix domain
MSQAMPDIEVMRAIEVLTLEEAVTYLRVTPEALLRQVMQGNLPGRKIEDSWRFLKTAIDD